jgi:hypothetical protein
VVEEEAERVRIIFRRYLELGSLNPTLAPPPYQSHRSASARQLERDPIPYALETDWPVGAAGFEPPHLEIRSAELHRAKRGSWAAGQRLRLFLRVLPAHLQFEMRKCESCPLG